MKRIRFVFYIAKFEWRNFLKGRKIHLVDDGISLWTGLFNWWTPGYSHMSVWIRDDDRVCFVHVRFPDYDDDKAGIGIQRIYKGNCYTSTMRGDDNGTVSRPASTVFTHPDRWHYIEFEVTDESFEEAKAWADERVKNNKGYSLRDLWRFAMPLWMLKGLKIADPDREICSEHGEGWAKRLVYWCSSVSELAYAVVVGGWPLLEKVLIRSPRRLWRDLVRRNHVPTYSLATGLIVRDSRGKKVK